MSSILLKEINRLKAENSKLRRSNRFLIESRDYWRKLAGSTRRGKRAA